MEQVDNTSRRYSVAVLVAVVLVSIMILSAINFYSKDKIADNKLQATRKVFDDIIQSGYTNDIFNDFIEVIEPAYLGNNRAVTIYRIRNDETPLGVIIHPVIASGYNSDIELGIGISMQGRITGVRVTSENETEGLGDQINQNKSNWLSVFDGKSFTNLPPEQWRVITEDGYFDQLSGATITSRSVITAVKDALNYYELENDNLYNQ